MNKFYFAICSLLAATSANAVTLEWDKIEHWVGEGSCKAALIMQFNPEQGENPGAIVWGFRFNPTDNCTGLDMMLSVVRDCDDLTVMTQLTGDMGYTLCGAGYAKDRGYMLDNLTYDLQGALSDPNISFGFSTPETVMGQTKVPADARAAAAEAIEKAKETHYIAHPFNAAEYGYPAYDYDWWKLSGRAAGADCIWNSGWYVSYWSFYTGSDTDLDYLDYSGMGVSSTDVMDGDIHAWRFRPSVQGTPVNTEWLEINYAHFNNDNSTAVSTIIDRPESTVNYYRLDGTSAGDNPGHGIYIMVADGIAKKVIL